ncbi:MAG TPA: bifunctional YncE family protein/alkaline phosphatase family protein [Terracidiphilus sp.]|jgi:DNA-binding beta-propeller fold protein YncE|nr:bifunctional YncE family protein/alkaline phosphatase family protein [Terracidiphilus sp.]
MYRDFLFAIFSTAFFLAPTALSSQTIDLPSSKQLIGEVPGHPQRLNSLPISMAVSPDHRYVVTVNAGYGTFESKYEQSLAVLDTTTGSLTDFPDSRTMAKVSRQTLYSGLAFSRDGKHIYASIASLSNPLGGVKNGVGSGILVYSFADGRVTPERMISLPLQQLPAGRKTLLIGEKEGDKGLPYPAAIAVVGAPGAEMLLVAENLSDDVILLDPATGAIKTRFDLSESDAVPSTYPVALAVPNSGTRAFVALWNSSEVVELNLATQTVGRKLALLKPSSSVAPGTHPSAFAFSPDEKTLYVALSNRDAVAAVNIEQGQLASKGYFDTRLPAQSYFGAEPVALAVNRDGSRLYVANMGSDAVAVIDTRKLNSKVSRQGMVEPDGFIPTEWMPISMAASEGKLYVATDKGKGTGPNNFAQRQVATRPKSREDDRTYIASLLYGSLATLNESEITANLPQWTSTVLQSNRMKAAAETIKYAGGARNRIKHVIYIIKENRTYDQILGDLTYKGKHVGNGDPSLTMYGQSVTPNEHKLALQFGVLDNFFDSGEVSGDGHVWSNAAIGTDYLEKTWQQNYRGTQRSYDFEGVVAEGYPLLQKIPDVNEPHSGYLWGNLAAHGKTYYHFAEYISTKFCNAKKTANPQQGPVLEGESCNHPAIAPGQPIPEEWGGGVNKWPWAIPLIASNIATKPELVGHFAKEYPDFGLLVPDQVRFAIFERHLKQWIADREHGRDNMPSFIQLRFPNDHTAGTTPGSPTPNASVADNDLAVGRAIEAVSHSPYWDDTAFFILEDDAQNGADHVDAHRSIAFVVSKYSPRAADGGPYVDSRFYSTVSMVRTMEVALGLPPMNNDDAFCSVISSLLTGPGDQAPYTADYSNRDNGLIYTANTRNSFGARESAKMNFTHEDSQPTEKLNVILWKDAMGNKPVPALLRAHAKKSDKDDDD